MTPQPTPSREALRQELDVLRQMTLLALGAAHPFHRDVDAAWRSRDTTRMRRALDQLERLPDPERDYVLGLDHGHVELTGAD